MLQRNIRNELRRTSSVQLTDSHTLQIQIHTNRPSNQQKPQANTHTDEGPSHPHTSLSNTCETYSLSLRYSHAQTFKFNKVVSCCCCRLVDCYCCCWWLLLCDFTWTTVFAGNRSWLLKRLWVSTCGLWQASRRTRVCCVYRLTDMTVTHCNLTNHSINNPNNRKTLSSWETETAQQKLLYSHKMA